MSNSVPRRPQSAICCANVAKQCSLLRLTTAISLRKNANSFRTGLVPQREACRLIYVSSGRESVAVDSSTGCEYGPSELATLRLLEWSRLCSFVANFASTSLGRQKLLDLTVARSQSEAERLQTETLAADLLEARYAANIDFGGISTSQAEAAVRRARKGGALTAPQLLAVTGLTAGASRLKRIVNATAKQAGEIKPGSLLQPFLTAVKGIESHQSMETAINRAIAEGGIVRDEASDEVGRTRARVRTLEGRLKNLLKGMNGEPSEQGHRLCLAVPGGGATPKGVLLGSSPGGAIVYVEPPAAVPMNNELAAARGEAYAAEEAVLWRLTGVVMEVVYSLQHILEVVVWMDVAVAKARYGRWIEGTFPEFGGFPRTHLSRKKGGGKANSIGSADEDYWIHLRRLRHPLLLGDWLESQAQAKQSSNGGARSKGISIRRLGNRKENMGNQDSTDVEASPPQTSNAPVPIDLCVRQETRAVVITGPNTGGKTATLKALGLAVLMAKSGLPVPAVHPVVLPSFSSVLADIGDEQSLSSSLSTFSGHLKRIQGLRREADGKSLVLLDEVGTGTDPAQGAALGVALLKALAKGGIKGAAFTLATTHHSALTGLKYEDPRFENASVEFDEEKLAPTFRLLWGIPGRSNALNTAARIGLLPEIVQAAKERLGANLHKVDNTIVQLEDLRSSQEAEENRAAAVQRQLARLEREFAFSRRKLTDEEANLKLDESDRILRVVEQAEARLQKLSSNKVRQERKEKREKSAAAENAKLEEKKRQQEVFDKRNPFVPTPGSMVFVPKLKGRGQVLAVKGDEVTVQMGMLKVATKVQELSRS